MAHIFAGLAQLSLRADLPVQAAAVCYRQNGSSVEFLLVKTSSGKWTFPKGRLNPSMSASESAAREAWEEAGVHGQIAKKHFGSYVDTKRALGHDLRTSEVRILAYLLEVYHTVEPEETGRYPTWYEAREAKKRLSEGRVAIYGKLIANIVDAALENLPKQQSKRPRALARTRGQRLAPVR
jgi:8-oxo-dGTP pyrophosphatase MutT (NUDIX family)